MHSSTKRADQNSGLLKGLCCARFRHCKASGCRAPNGYMSVCIGLS